MQPKAELFYGDNYKEVTAISVFSDFCLKKFNLKMVTFKLAQHKHMTESHVQHISMSLTWLPSVTNSNLYEL
jgi:hypothetical protein